MTGMKTPAAAIVALVFCVSGCKVGPNYSRPALNVPGQYRGVAPDLSNQPNSIAETNWESVYQDETLLSVDQRSSHE